MKGRKRTRQVCLGGIQFCPLGCPTNPPLCMRACECVTGVWKATLSGAPKGSLAFLVHASPAPLPQAFEGCHRDNYSPQTELATPGSHSNC